MTQIGRMIFDDGFKAGEKEGEARGEIRGRNQKLIEQSCRKLRKGKTPEMIAQELEESLELIQSICQAASGFAPDYDSDKVFGVWQQAIL